jgi:hypothetical protein
MTTTTPTTTAPARDVEQLSAGLAEAFRTGVPGDLFTSDFFLDGHPPFWWFQIQGLEPFTAWLGEYVAHGPAVDVVRTTTTDEGFLSEHLVSETVPDRGLLTARRLHVCVVRSGQIAEMTVFCSGDWDEALRERHAAEASILRRPRRHPLPPPTHP